VAGRGTFLHDILIAAGGEKVAAQLPSPWPNVDRDMIAHQKPQVVIHLLPSASPQVLAAARKFWADQPDLPAVRERRVHLMTEWYALLPGYHVGTMAEQFGRVLHPLPPDTR
jgi:iron complex transport system substrate-binding protein